MTLKQFLTTLWGRLQQEEIPYCILRNHDGLPEHNPGRDIDMLVQYEDLPRILTVIGDIDGIAVTGLLRRSYVCSLYIHGILWGDGLLAIEIDMVTGLAWKGQPYLDAGDVLARRRSPPSRPSGLLVPAPLDEAIISLFSYYLATGEIRQKYWPDVRAVLTRHDKAAIATLSRTVGTRLAEDIVDAVISDSPTRILDLRPRVLRTLLARALYRTPIMAMTGIAAHYAAELRIRFTLTHVTLVCILGPDGAGKSSVIQSLRPSLRNLVGEIEIRHLKPIILLRRRTRPPVPTTSVDAHAAPLRGSIGSVVKLLAWMVELWLEIVITPRRVPTLKIYDRYLHDILVDPARYRYGAPRWIARAISALVVEPDLFVILDAPADVIQRRKQEVPFVETKRQRDAYRGEIGVRDNAVIVDAARPVAAVANDVLAAIVAALNERVKRDHGVA